MQAIKRENRIYIAIDLKSFYASVECVERGLDPLKAKLVVADPTRTDKTICLAVSPALKAYGIPGRIRLFEVKQKLKIIEERTGEKIDFEIAPPQMAHYIKISSEIYEVYLKYVSPEDIHVYSIDECFIDVTHYLELYHMTPKQLATAMIHDVLDKTGITATAGIGTNLYLAKISMDIVAKHVSADEYGVRIASLDEMTYRKLLWGHRPITDFWRVGNGIAKRLEKIGLYTMGDVARASIYEEDVLYKEFGIDAELLIDHAWGFEPCTIKQIKNYKPTINSISSGQVLHTPYDIDKARLIVKEMTDSLVLDLVEKGLSTDSVTLTVGYERIEETTLGGKYNGKVAVDRYGRIIPKSAHGTANLRGHTSSTSKIMDGVLKLYDKIIDNNLQVRRITICANNVTNQGYEQLDLFSNTEQNEKEKKIQEAMLSIKKKYGKNSILKGMNLEEGATERMRNEQIGGHKA